LSHLCIKATFYQDRLGTNIGKTQKVDRFSSGGFYAQLVTNIFMLPLLTAFACYVYYLNEKKTINRMVAEGATDAAGLQSAKLNLQRNLMVGLFVMYPMMTTTLFRSKIFYPHI
jgi:hypothetical protein